MKKVFFIPLFFLCFVLISCTEQKKYAEWEEKWENTEAKNSEKQETETSIEPPADAGKLQKYNAMEQGLITPIELQQKENDSPDVDWLYSAFQVIEANIIKQGKATKDNIDLSEGHYLYYGVRFPEHFKEDTTEDIVYVNSPYKLNATDIYYKLRVNNYFLLLLAEGVGPVSEKTVPFDESNRESIKKSIENLMQLEAQGFMHEDMSDWLLTEYNSIIMKDRDVIKELILERGALQLEYDLSDMYLSLEGAIYSPYSARYTSHTATIIGWDDTYSKTNFLEKYQPENNGAWIIYDSAGPIYGMEGIFYISYEDATIGDISSYKVSPRSAYGEILSYDKYGVGEELILEDETETVIANVYKTKEAKEIQAIGIFTLCENQPVEINIYTDVLEGNPSRGTLVSTTHVTPEWYGYHVIDLEQAVSVRGESEFSIVIKYAANETTGFAPVEGPSWDSFMDPKVYRHMTSQPGQSYVLIGGEWMDLTEQETLDAIGKEEPVNNACIKVLFKNNP